MPPLSERADIHGIYQGYRPIEELCASMDSAYPNVCVLGSLYTWQANHFLCGYLYTLFVSLSSAERHASYISSTAIRKKLKPTTNVVLQ